MSHPDVHIEMGGYCPACGGPCRMTANPTIPTHCTRYAGSDGTLCATHHGRFASPDATDCERPTNPTTPDHAALREALLKVPLLEGGVGGWTSTEREVARLRSLRKRMLAAFDAASPAPEPPTADATPRTEAATYSTTPTGQRLVTVAREWADKGDAAQVLDLIEFSLRAIEAEARADALAAVKERVEGIKCHCAGDVPPHSYWCAIAPVLAAIREEENHA